jgi:two-component system phosphate regulon sensor histidine kinase PhoR
MVVIISLAICSATLVFLFSDHMLDSAKEDMVYTMKVIDHHLLKSEDISLEIIYLMSLIEEKGATITITDVEGNIVISSEQQSPGNDIQSTEFLEALNTGLGFDIRDSSMSNQRAIFAAYYNEGYVIHMVTPYTGLFLNTRVILSVTMIVVISILATAIFTNKISKYLSNPLREIRKEIRKMNQREKMTFNKYKYDEYNLVANALLTQKAITQKTMDRLQLEKLKIATILDQMNEGFILLDTNMMILIVNQKAKEILNRGMQVKRHIKEYVFQQEIIEALEKQEVQHNVDLTLEQRIYSCIINKLEYGITLLFVDITQSRQASKIRQEFFSNVSHELKTPMTSIKGYTELLQADMVQDESIKKDMLNKVQKEVTHMSTLINDILTISRLETKDVLVNKYPLRVKSIVEDVVSSLFLEANKKEVIIYTSCDDIIYEADAQHMHQILNNLVSNAIKYNKDNGKVTIKIYEKISHLYIEVVDTGIGIPLVEQDRIFERFYRCDKARSRSVGGTGLGLSIVKHIVQYYKGTIQLQSAVNQGTTIKVILPKNL